MRQIAATLTVKIDRRIAAAVPRRALIAPTEALLTRPGFEQRRVDGEVLVRWHPFIALRSDAVRNRFAMTGRRNHRVMYAHEVGRAFGHKRGLHA